MAKLNLDSTIAPVWQLPVHRAERNGNGYIAKNQVYHCYKDNQSLCGYCNQVTTDYDDGITIESGKVLEYHQYVCKRCYEKWKKISL